MALKHQFVRNMPPLTLCRGNGCLSENPRGQWKGTVAFVVPQGRNKFKMSELCPECRAPEKSIALV